MVNPQCRRKGYDMFGLGATELTIIAVIVIVLFGARRLPEIGSGVGKAIKNFRAGMTESDEIDVTPDPGKPGEVAESSSDSVTPEQRQKTEST